MTKFIGFATAGALVMAAAPALADTLTWGSPQWVEGSPGTVYVTYTGPAPPSPQTSPVNENVYAGELNLLDTTNTLSYNVFCTDIFDNWQPGTGSYTLGQIQNASEFKTGNSNMTFTSGQFNEIKALLNGVTEHSYITDAITSAAVQVAIWKIENDNSQALNSYDLASGDFTATNPSNAAILTDATTLLGNVDAASAPVWNDTGGNLQEWYVTSGNQDFTLLAVTQHTIGVPEPGSLILLASGLAGVAAFRRRRGRA